MRTGGHVHALIKGDRETEYTLVGLGGTLPFISTSAESVARRLWQAVCDGDAEVIAGWPAVIAAKVHGLFPNWTAEALALLSRVLPHQDGSPVPIRGGDVQGRLPEILSRQIPRAARPDVGARHPHRRAIAGHPAKASPRPFHVRNRQPLELGGRCGQNGRSDAPVPGQPRGGREVAAGWLAPRAGRGRKLQISGSDPPRVDRP